MFNHNQSINIKFYYLYTHRKHQYNMFVIIHIQSKNVNNFNLEAESN